MLADPCLRVARHQWNAITRQLHHRTEGCHESGAFLLGTVSDGPRNVQSIVYYDELDPKAYDTGVCVLRGDSFARLWDRCSQMALAVVADVHVHGRSAAQSLSDRTNPMIARHGHIALILPLMSRYPVRRWAIGFYEYQGDHQWRAYRGRDVARVLKIEEAR